MYVTYFPFTQSLTFSVRTFELSNSDIILNFYFILGQADPIKSEEIEGPLAAAAASTTRPSTAGGAAAAAGVPQTSDMITCYPSMKGKTTIVRF